MPILKTNYSESAMVNNSVINYQNILLDTLDEPTNITFSTPSSLNSLVTKHKTSFTVNGPHIKKYQIAMDYLKRQILTEVTQEIKKMQYIKLHL